MAEILTQAPIDWDEQIERNPDGGNPLQLGAFGAAKAIGGWQPRYVRIGKVALLALSRTIPLLGEMWYIPRGPGVLDTKDLQRFTLELPKSLFMVKFDPEILPKHIRAAEIERMGYVRAPRSIQYNETTAIVDLRPDSDTILSGFKQKTRYNIRLSAKKGVTVAAVPLDQTAIDTMYNLYATTTQRAGVYLRDKDYFSTFWRAYASSDRGQMFFASYEGQILAGAFVIWAGHKGLYKDGGSVREHTAVQAPYALQWHIMQWLKERGITEYDLHGTPPADQINNPNHPLAGLARFKTGFQSDITEYVGTFDLPVQPFKYRLWRRIGERLAVTYEYRRRGRLFY